MPLMIPQHPQLVNLTHHEARAFPELLVLVLVPGFLIHNIQDRRC
jgi:hypothetical protein